MVTNKELYDKLDKLTFTEIKKLFDIIGVGISFINFKENEKDKSEWIDTLLKISSEEKILFGLKKLNYSFFLLSAYNKIPLPRYPTGSGITTPVTFKLLGITHQPES